MAIHIYMSTTKRKQLDDTGDYGFAPDTKMNYRGEAGPNDDPKGFAKMMSRRGHRVFFTGSRCKKENKPKKNGNNPLGPPWCLLSDLQEMK